MPGPIPIPCPIPGPIPTGVEGPGSENDFALGLKEKAFALGLRAFEGVETDGVVAGAAGVASPTAVGVGVVEVVVVVGADETPADESSCCLVVLLPSSPAFVGVDSSAAAASASAPPRLLAPALGPLVAREGEED
jgi:hypothetical protein